jgi:hypothetical protein
MPVIAARATGGKRGGLELVTLTFAALPCREFTYRWPAAVSQAETAALLARPEARNLVLGALATGEASTEYASLEPAPPVAGGGSQR